MPTGRTGELRQRFDSRIAELISTAYADVLLESNRKAPFTTEDRMAVVQVLIDAAERGQTELEHLKMVARRALELRIGSVLNKADGS
jgi:hypothetical protein